MSEPVDYSALLLEVLERLVVLLEELLSRTEVKVPPAPVPPRPTRP